MVLFLLRPSIKIVNLLFSSFNSLTWCTSGSGLHKIYRIEILIDYSTYMQTYRNAAMYTYVKY